MMLLSNHLSIVTIVTLLCAGQLPLVTGIYYIYKERLKYIGCTKDPLSAKQLHDSTWLATLQRKLSRSLTHSNSLTAGIAFMSKVPHLFRLACRVDTGQYLRTQPCGAISKKADADRIFEWTIQVDVALTLNVTVFNSSTGI